MRNARFVWLTALGLAASASGQAVPERVALTGARIITVAGPDIERGTILIDRGKIAAVGTDVELPYDAVEVELDGRWVMPGMIDPHSWGGLDRANESLPVMPYLDVYDAIDPSRLFFEDSLRDGVTSVHVIQGNNTVIGGVSRVVMPIGLSVDEMTQRIDVALKMSTTPMSGADRMRQMSALRDAFLELEDYLDRIAEEKYEKELEKDGRKIDVGPAEARQRGRALLKDADYDDQHRNLVRLKRGDLAAFIYCGMATDVGPAIAVARENGLLDRAVFVLGPQAFKAIGELKEAGRPVIVDNDLYYRERDPVTGEVRETFVPRVVHEAGLEFALQPNPSASMAERYLNYQAAVCVREGIPRDVALRAITHAPAKMLGMGDDVGTVEVGKTANLVVFSGDPLAFDSWVDLVYINGILAYDRSRDARLKRILDLDKPTERQTEGDQEPQP